jgi:protein kinase A
LVKPLGEGFFGQVLLVRCKHDSRLYALKRMPKKPVIESKQVDHLLNEIKILRTLSHPNVVTFHHFFQDSAYVCLLLEHLQGGGLFGYLRAAKTLGKEQARLYCGQVVLALEYLHSNSVIYRDLKP